MSETTNHQSGSTRACDILIVGGGPGGYTAALYAARSGLQATVLERRGPGGQMALTGQIDNYPGFDAGISGFRLSGQMRQSAERFGARSVFSAVLELQLHGPEKLARTAEGVYPAKTVVISTGADPRPLGLPEEARWLGRGVHYCAACDGRFYKGKTVAVIGGGNTALSDALLLAALCKTVYLIHRRDALRAERIYQDALQRAENIRFLPCQRAVQLLGDQTLTGLRLQHTQTGRQTELACDGVFVSIGRTPASELVRTQLACDPQGYLIAGESTRTALPGVFAVGDVRAKPLRQIVTAAADGAVAAHYAHEYLSSGRWGA